MKNLTIQILVLFFFVHIIIFPAVACTTISASIGNAILFGANEEQLPNSSSIFIDSTGTYGVIYFTTPFRELPSVIQMGINGRGLSYDADWLPAEDQNIHTDKKLVRTAGETLGILDQVMKETSTVEEVVKKFLNYNWGEKSSVQYHFADRNGNAVVIYPGLDGEMKYHIRSNTNEYLITNNFNHARRIKSSRSFLDFVYSTLFDQKFDIADSMLKKQKDKSNLSVEALSSILNATHRNWILDTPFSMETIFSVVFDIQELQIYLFYDRQYDSPVILDIKKELAITNDSRKLALKDLAKI